MNRINLYALTTLFIFNSTLSHAQEFDAERTAGITAVVSGSVSGLGVLGAKIENDSIKQIIGQSTLRVDPVTAERNLQQLSVSKLTNGLAPELYNSFADDAGKIYHFDRNGNMTKIVEGKIMPASQAEINRYGSIGKAFAKQTTAELASYRKVVRGSKTVAIVAGVVAVGSTVAYALTRNTNPEVQTKNKIKYQSTLANQGNK